MSTTLAQYVVTKGYTTMSRKAAEAALVAVKRKRDSLICVATGASPTGVYEELARAQKDLSRVRILKLDEWGGLHSEDPATCEVYIQENIIDAWGLAVEQFNGFLSDCEDPKEECARVRTQIEELGGIDVCILGMGIDGHIGLNYPAPNLPAEAHVTSAETLKHTMLQKSKRPPTCGLTLGMAEVLRSRRIILVISGVGKAQAVKRLMTREITTEFPASLLWMHGDIHCFIDEDAASAL